MSRHLTRIVRLLACILFLFAPQTRAQTSPATFDFQDSRIAVTSLDGQWRFHTGDDLYGTSGWADATYDDSSWSIIRSDKSWTAQGYRDYGGSAWYRVHIVLPQHPPPLALYIPAVATNYQLYADGNLIATLGSMPPHPSILYSSVPRLFNIPAPRNGNELVLAIRVWQSPYWVRAMGGGLQGGILIGNRALVSQRFVLDERETAWRQVHNIVLAILECLAGLAAISLFVLRTEEAEYLWFGLLLLASSSLRCLSTYVWFHPIGRTTHDLLNQILYNCTLIAAMTFFYRFLRGRPTFLFWVAVGAIPANLTLLVLGVLQKISVSLWIPIGISLTLPLAIWSIPLLIRRAIEGVPDARLLCFPVLLQQLVYSTARILNLGFLTGWFRVYIPGIFFISAWPFSFSLLDVADLLFLIGMLAILLRRFSRTRSREEFYEREREAARSVQQVLIADKLPDTPGYSIQNVYRPASEVGGDFFQIFPIQSGSYAGSLLVAIGDVSGKGLPAAMTVSLLVGAFRTLTEFTHEPAKILAGMNNSMLSRQQEGFASCLILRADLQGVVSVANAGHLSPYLNGHEVEIDSSFPLGLVANCQYSESSFELESGLQLTLLTDGVVEARNPSGELFGFDRTSALSRQSAETIARYAQQFGQEDDITVLTLSRIASAG
ncbi:PP2C family protein-serine/threonine phosphatase [Acidicapsa dinghuensis]|uniref:PP2C family protein-serine/threonine phosphatase n=1 Tax=Acidicapsa dinghuensis TaxID=2218256 RepID=A0ABW1E9W3_9BACT|nr:PP2C family protein-serine/threonine phosphatase [Acidicapsa dinghuensis]